ncbi:MAG: type II secretion system F family protein [Candidatus Aenigmarchaeota archaeon]|nr:type II secretion system F family protein [Candidatus Aenigmarchaeota archaeon]
MKVPEYFLSVAGSYEPLLSRLEPSMQKARMKVLPQIYAGKALYFTSLAFVISFAYVLVMGIFLRLGILQSVFLSISTAIIVSAITVSGFLLYPRSIASSKKKNVETNLPFAALHMRALAGSGVPPQDVFRVLAESDEYGEVAEESRRIYRNMEVFGMDLITAVREAAKETPSDEMRQFLNGIAATISSGGDLQEYMRIASERSMTNYKLKREKWLSTLSTYADFYIGVLIAAPLFFVSILSMLAVIGGSFAGLSIPAAMYIGIYAVLPALNIAFLLFVHYTQPAV